MTAPLEGRINLKLQKTFQEMEARDDLLVELGLTVFKWISSSWIVLVPNNRASTSPLETISTLTKSQRQGCPTVRHNMHNKKPVAE